LKIENLPQSRQPRHTDSFFLQAAIQLAKRATNPAPNPRVGALVVRSGKIVGAGWHEAAGGPHAEIVALRRAGAKAKGATLYLTLEPCHHTGRTPPCSRAILAAGIQEVVIGMADPNQQAAGGADFLRANKIKVKIGLRAKECQLLNQIWLKNLQAKLPYVTLKLALDVAGSTIPPAGRKWITGAASRQRVQKLRAAHDAILVGVNTIIADNPRLTVRSARKQPTRIILDPSGRTPKSAQIFKELGQTIIVTKKQTKFPRAENLAVPSFDLKTILKKIAARGLTSIFVEGGATTATHLLRAKLIDQVHLFQAGGGKTPPKLFGSKLPLQNLQTAKIGPDQLYAGLLQRY
jgi:diaminohydroxyphosphoribosylaminopyrimidine deaminase/5-amino-6-(5-phosphoribosylamino)uracil reductase